MTVQCGAISARRIDRRTHNEWLEPTFRCMCRCTLLGVYSVVCTDWRDRGSFESQLELSLGRSHECLEDGRVLRIKDDVAASGVGETFKVDFLSGRNAQKLAELKVRAVSVMWR